MSERAAEERAGPRPLPLHLMAAWLIWASSHAALPLARSGLLVWKDELAAEGRRLARALEREPVAELASALGVAGARRLAAMLEGISAYRAHPYRRRLPEPPVPWREGSSRLLDYGGAERAGPPIVFVPSLVNRGYILDLSERRSLLRFLSARGLRPLLLEWGAPDDTERHFAFDDYIGGRLERALDWVALAGRPIVLAGYCMGGLMALAAALSRRDIAGLALLATPWDFHAERAEDARRLGQMMAALEAVLAPSHPVPVDLLQALFALLDPARVPAKFRAFAALDPASAEALDFVALEDWANDGIPLPLAVAREVFVGWYGENRPGRGLWRVAGRAVDPARLAVPSFAVIPKNDRIVSPKGAATLARAIPGAKVLSAALGHVGMVASARAPEAVWQPLADWLLSLKAAVPAQARVRRRARRPPATALRA